MCAYKQNPGDRFQGRGKKLGRCILKFFPYRPVHSSVFVVAVTRNPQTKTRSQQAKITGKSNIRLNCPFLELQHLLYFFSSGDATGGVNDEIRQYNNNGARNRDF